MSGPSRKMLIGAAFLLLTCLIVKLAATSYLPAYWPIEIVSVEGSLNAGERQQISNAVAGFIDQGFLFINLEDVVHSVMALSWPREVEVRRSWPNKLKLNVRKQALVAHWNGTDYLSTSGQVVHDPDIPKEDLPDFFAVHADGIRTMRIFEGLESVIQDTELEISELREDSLGNWALTFRSGLQVMLGSQEINSRLARFVEVYSDSLQSNISQVLSIDARYRNGVAVKWYTNTLDTPAAILASNKAITHSAASEQR